MTMKKNKPVMVLLFLCAVFFISCSTPLLINYTNQPIENAIRLSQNMGKSEVQAIMGTPIKTEFSKNVEEWHYCKTGIGGTATPADQFVAVFFHDNRVVAMKNYSVTFADAGSRGDCSLFIKRGNYYEPDTVKELRVR